MPSNRKPIHPYPVNTVSEPEKYLSSIFFDVEVNPTVLKAEVRPLQKDRGYYTVNLDKVFLGHIHKVGNIWKDFLGSDLEVYQLVGKKIEEHLRNKAGEE
ncbi:MAG TPA: hypothetical protein VGQ53_11700 [Chitinophagaceae bacterium]|jgi:hypothetical protein|nr:hypothetical protein [Chitinophagaceae bacterium]